MSLKNVDIGKICDDLVKSVEAIDKILEVKDSVREELIRITRDVTRLSGDAITYIHLGEYDKAYELLKKVEELVRHVMQLTEEHPDLRYSGLVNNALSEYVEAKLLYAIVVEKRFMRYDEFSIHYIPYLLGLCDLIGELKRLAIDAMRRDDIETAESCLKIMEAAYNSLRRLDYAEALTPGLRHKVDIMRRIVEDLKMFLLDIAKRNVLVDALSRVEKKLSKEYHES